jgi:5-methylcytosine-specific restriction endonuclease McrA
MVFECEQFDTHLMKNPSLANEKVRHWGYQKGPNYRFANTREMVLNRDGYKCKKCKGKSGRKSTIYYIKAKAAVTRRKTL